MVITIAGLLVLFPALITVVNTRMDHLKEQAEKVAFLFCFRFPFSKAQWLAEYFMIATTVNTVSSTEHGTILSTRVTLYTTQGNHTPFISVKAPASMAVHPIDEKPQGARNSQKEAF